MRLSRKKTTFFENISPGTLKFTPTVRVFPFYAAIPYTGPRKSILDKVLEKFGKMKHRQPHIIVLLGVLLAVPPVQPAFAAGNHESALLRAAAFNVSLSRNEAGKLIEDLSAPDNPQAKAAAEIIQLIAPDIILLNEFDYDSEGRAAELFRRNYLEVSQNGAEPIRYPYIFIAESNTGIPSGLDLNNDGDIGGPGDAYGFGFFPGQYGMLILSRFPIDTPGIRTFQNFLWRDMPGALLPDDPASEGAADWYSAEELDSLRLSSKSHWDVPVKVGNDTIHILASHPTPPVFDDPPNYPEGVDFNGRRNHDEIRFWADYIDPAGSRYIYDDHGRRGGLRRSAKFVICGDLNADPFDGDSTGNPIALLLESDKINTEVTPVSSGGPDAAERQGGNNLTHIGDPAFDTADFGEENSGGPGNLRVDYVLPSRKLRPAGGGVYWPPAEGEFFRLVGDYPFPSSDHRLVFIDLAGIGLNDTGE